MVIHIEAISTQFRKKIEREINEMIPNFTGSTNRNQPSNYMEKHADILIREGKRDIGVTNPKMLHYETVQFTSEGYYQLDKIAETYLPAFTQIIQSASLGEVLQQAMQRVHYKKSIPSNAANEGGPKIIVQKPEALLILSVQDIIYVQAWGKYCFLHTCSGEKHVLYKSLSDFMKNANENIFFQCHKSFIVNINQIEAIHKEVNLRLKSMHIIPLARRRRQKLISMLSEHTTI